ncbi:myosin-binding protein 2 isoform X2 [Populus alba]|uniref:myosin-binding protein 2 isoform X2 n=1 Tax=Populus alba TaxID=43335 RepID=UPI00158BB0E3|nr:myosin-binding protein 2 isoform X2 [Populus alba]
MVGNKFATMLQRNTNKITLILVYAILEWILIILLLLNSLFSYLIIKFADYFGLKRPCLWCSRLDHFFEPANFQNSYRSLVCDDHAKEISKLGYCSSHRKLAESQDMCEGCSSSSPHGESLSKFAFFPWMTQLGVLQDLGGDKVSENGEDLKCSCCGVCLDTKLYCDDYYLIKPSYWGDSGFTQKGNLILEHRVDDTVDVDDHSDRERSDFVSDFCEGEQGIGENRGIEIGNREEEVKQNFSCSVSNFYCKEVVADDGEKEEMVMKEEEEPVKKDDLNVQMDNPPGEVPAMVQAGSSKDTATEIQPQHLEFYIDQDDCHLIPVELIGFNSTEKQIPKRHEKGVEENSGNEDFVLEFDKQVGTQYELVVEDRSNLEEEVPLLSVDDNEEEPSVAVVESREILEKESSSSRHSDLDLVEEECEQVATAQPIHTPSNDGIHAQESALIAGEDVDSDYNQVSEEVLQMQSDEIEADVSIGTEIPDQEQIDDVHYVEKVSPSYSCMQEDPSTSNADYHAYEDHAELFIALGSKQAEEDAIEFRTITVETGEPSLHTESNELEEDKMPDTPTSMDRFHHQQKKLLLLERRESGTEESLDGSIISDIDVGDGVLTMEKLKSALRAERKTLSALYAELEEERSASAVAASQTMAMINRLQEEKAAMQMEAFQYQRMMEEQSEYDQEALQLLSELVVKREKEKAELEKEVEVYRKKVQDNEMKDKLMMLKRRKDGSTTSVTTSPSCSNAEDTDGLSVDLNHEGKEVIESFDNHQESNHPNTPIDAVLYLDESLANFEEERVSILEQLKVLEEKLFMLSDEEEQHFEDIKPIEHLFQENGNGYSEICDYSSESNGVANGQYKEMNGKHHQERRNIGAKAKRLLPLFDAIDTESEGILNGQSEGFDSVALQKSVNKFDMNSKKLAVEEEVDHVYERLQALEADREFLKHCMTSLRKGDKGIELLQEILRHLRDLRNVEQRVRNFEDGAL